MDYFKKIERSVTISADKRSTVDLQVDIWSQDLNVTKFILKLDTIDSAAIDLTNATVRVAMVYSQDGQDVKIEEAGIVEDVATQKIAYVMGDRLAGFEGQVTAGFYVTLSTGQRIDIQNVTFNMRKSLLDKDLEAAKESYYQTFDDVVSDVQSEGEKAKTEINQVLPNVQAEGEKVKTNINAVVSNVNGYADTQKQAINNIVSDVQSTGDTAKTQIGQVLPDVQSEGEKVKTQINAFVSNVNGYADTQKQAIDDVVSDVQSTGDTAKTQIGQVLPDVQSKVSAINTELAKIDENMPDLFVAYADSDDGTVGFSLTDTSKMYKGYGVKNSNYYADYRWEKNVDSLQIGGRNLLKDTGNFGNNGRPSGAKDGWLDSYDSTIETEKYNGLTVRSIKNVTTPEVMCEYYFTGFNLGDTYTFSFWAKGTIDAFRCYFYGDNGYVRVVNVTASNGYKSDQYDGTCLFNNNDISENEWRRLWITWKLSNTGDINIAKRVLIRTDGATGGDLYVCGVKLEKGNQATDWSPATEDKANKSDLDSHTSNRNNPHAVTASQVGAYTKAEVDTKDNTMLNSAKSYADSKANTVQSNLNSHTGNRSNPHNVTASQVGTYTKQEIDSKDSSTLSSAKSYADGKANTVQSSLNSHTGNRSNPHGVTASQVGAYSKSETYSRAEVDSKVSVLTTYSKSQIDEKDTTTLNNAKDYADAQDVTNLTSAKSYTDSQVSNAKTSIISGNVASASKLATARTIAGVLFDGSANISIGAGNVGAYTKSETDTKDTSILASAKTYADSQIAAAKSTIIAGNVASASKLAATRLINGVEFDGSKDISLSTDNIGTYNKSTIDSKDAGILSSSKSYTDTRVNNAKASIVAGNVATATKLQTARTIAGVLFDGTANISIGPSNVGTYSQSDINAKDTSTLNNAKSYADAKKNEAVSYTNSQVTDLRNHVIFVGTEAQWNALGTTEQNKYILKAIVE